MVSIIEKVPLPAEIDPNHISNIVKFIQKSLKIPNDEISIIFDSNIEIQKLNKRYANIDKSTDVLSFTISEINPETGNNYLGDIIISIEQSMIQADEHQHGLEEELILLITHGILHLIGFDHADKKESDLMFSKQNQIICSLHSK